MSESPYRDLCWDGKMILKSILTSVEIWTSGLLPELLLCCFTSIICFLRMTDDLHDLPTITCSVRIVKSL
jgi:hypothetical protein